MCTGTTPACGNTCARGAGTHGDVLSGHTEFRSVSHTNTQDPAGTDPIDPQLPRGATSSGTPQTSTPSETRLIDTKSLLQVTPYHGDKASFLGWKWSFLIAVRENQQTTL